MKTKNKWLLAATGILMSGIFFMACKKENSGSSSATAEKSQLSVYMMDDPAVFTSVLIDIKQVAVKIDTAAHHGDADDSLHQWKDDYRGCHNGNSTIWDTLAITPGVYDLLKLRNGTDTLLSSSLVATGKILQVKITLGTNNTVTDSVTTYPLNLIGSSNTFILNVRREDVSVVSNSQFKLWFDFNLSRSIFYINGKYWLKPAMTIFNDATKPKLEGRVLPQGASGFVAVYNSSDTLYALPWIGGYYQVRGINAGTYSVYFKGWRGYKDTTINNITVGSSGLTTVPTITLHK